METPIDSLMEDDNYDRAPVGNGGNMNGGGLSVNGGENGNGNGNVAAPEGLVGSLNIKELFDNKYDFVSCLLGGNSIGKTQKCLYPDKNHQP
jgi:hypothetical protein